MSERSLSLMSSSGCAKPLAELRARILTGCYRKSDANDPEIYGRALVAVLMRYPANIVMAVTEPTTGLPSKLKWLPSIAEIVEACDARWPRKAPPRPAIEALMDRSERPTYDQLRQKYGPNWGLKTINATDTPAI